MHLDLDPLVVLDLRRRGAQTSTSWDRLTQPAAGSSPARTSRFSELRRMRVARWSSLNRSASRPRSCSPFSSPSISESCRSTRVCVRRDRLTNIALMFERSSDSLGGQPDRLAVDLVEGPGDLADLVLGVDGDRGRLPASVLSPLSAAGARSPAAGIPRRPGRRPAAGAAAGPSTGDEQRSDRGPGARTMISGRGDRLRGWVSPARGPG